jgi:hypothetical protein
MFFDNGTHFRRLISMPRQPRLELPGVPMHVTQRGANRCATFLDDEDRILSTLAVGKIKKN